MKMNKYGARKVKAPDGQVFDSRKEYQRYGVLRLLERAGKISGLCRQVSYELIPKQDGERACSYIADFRYFDENGKLVVEDCKGYRTEAYKIKKKLMLWVHGIKIKET